MFDIKLHAVQQEKPFPLMMFNAHEGTPQVTEYGIIAVIEINEQFIRIFIHFINGRGTMVIQVLVFSFSVS